MLKIFFALPTAEYRVGSQNTMCHLSTDSLRTLKEESRDGARMINFQKIKNDDHNPRPSPKVCG